MWTLTSKKTGEVYYLLPEKENYTVGRANADLVLAGDASISRSHACLYLTKDGIKVIDIGSKYGTFYNENIENKDPMQKNLPVELKNGERVKFGMLENEWILSKLNICTLTSTLTPDHKVELSKLFGQLAGRIVDKWERSCTHLSMSEITVTHKVLQALVENIPIVGIEFWRTYLENLRAGKPPPKPTEYLPKIAESFINHENVSFGLVPGRRTIFAGKNFVFMSSLPFEKYKPIIESAGGTCGNLYKGVPKSSLTKKNVIVIRAGSISQSQSSQTVEGISDFIKSKGRRVIPDHEIGLAILNCSTAKYCNPDYSVVNDFAPETNAVVPNSNIIAKHTPFLRSEHLKPGAVIELPESIAYEATEVLHNIDLESKRNEEEEIECTEKFIDLKSTMATNNSIDSPAAGKRKRIESPDRTTLKKLNLEHGVPKDNHSSTTTMSNGISENLFVETPTETPAANLKRKNQEPLPSTSAAKAGKTTVDVRMFMDTSQIVRTQNSEPIPEVNDEQEERPESKKRARIAAICSDDDGEDLFAFACSAAKKKKKGNENLTDSRVSQRSAQTRNKNRKDNSANTENQPQPVDSIATKPKFQLPAKIHRKIPTEGWLSKSLSRMKVEAEEIKEENSIKTENTDADWINSLKGGFEVRVRPMQLVSKSFRDTSFDVADSHTTASSSGRNFKAFVKKRNYKPQSTIITTVPVYVGLNARCDL